MVSFKELCGLTPAANMKQCILTVAAWLLHSDSAPSVTLNLAEQYPAMEAQGPIPDLLRKVLTAYETVSSGTGRLHGADGTSSASSTSSSILPRPQLCAWGSPGMGSPQSHWIHRRAGGGTSWEMPRGTPQTWDPTDLGPHKPGTPQTPSGSRGILRGRPWGEESH